MNMRLKPEGAALDPLHVEGWRKVFAKLEEFRKLEDDWDGEGSPAIPCELMDAAVSLARRFEISETPPRVVPTVNGTISLEWFTPDRFRGFEVVSSERVVETNWTQCGDQATVVDRTFDEVA